MTSAVSPTGGSSPERVLVLRFSSAGDVVLTSPAIHALKTAWPTTEIIYAIKKRYAPLIAHDPHVDRIVALDEDETLMAFSRRLAATGFDALLDLHGKIRSKLLRLVLPHRRRVVWTKRRWQDNVPVRMGWRPYRADRCISDRYHAAVEDLVGRELPRGQLRYFVGDDDQAETDALLQAHGIDTTASLVGMSPGANWATKRWPVEGFTELARRAIAAGHQVMVSGSWAERELGTFVKDHVAEVHDLTGIIPLRLLGAAIQRCTAFIANDSGPMHIARALGVPTLVFFGSTAPQQFTFEGHRMMFAGIPCSPCHFYGRKRCPRGHFDCMRKLTVDDAWNNLDQLLHTGTRPYLHA